mmetsp:Transcript_12744/g.32127  ORF Transcript_12744/g.32127 Transcript_12744/m.32127 type:complete len:90 (+) Transcript_12744:102-371(+)
MASHRWEQCSGRSLAKQVVFDLFGSRAACLFSPPEFTSTNRLLLKDGPCFSSRLTSAWSSQQGVASLVATLAVAWPAHASVRVLFQSGL